MVLKCYLPAGELPNYIICCMCTCTYLKCYQMPCGELPKLLVIFPSDWEYTYLKCYGPLKCYSPALVNYPNIGCKLLLVYLYLSEMLQPSEMRLCPSGELPEYWAQLPAVGWSQGAPLSPVPHHPANVITGFRPARMWLLLLPLLVWVLVWCDYSFNTSICVITGWPQYTHYQSK